MHELRHARVPSHGDNQKRHQHWRRDTNGIWARVLCWRDRKRDAHMHALPAAEAIGGFIAYSRHVKGWHGTPDEQGRCEVRVVFIDERASTPATRGLQLNAGTRLMQQMMQTDGDLG